MREFLHQHMTIFIEQTKLAKFDNRDWAIHVIMDTRTVCTYWYQALKPLNLLRIIAATPSLADVAGVCCS